MAMAQVILIDPGHGGSNCGAHSNGLCEKDVVLSIAKMIQRHLKKSYTTYLTRSVDRKLSLDDRAKQAEILKADLFISVHANASSSPHSAGFETFYLNNHDDAAVKKLEREENKDSLGEGEQAIINKILADLVVQRTAPRSQKLAELIHRRIAKKIRRSFSMENRGMKPALFHVLALTKRPAVLLEVGFLSNPKEARKITSKMFQKAYAQGVAQGIQDYVERYFKKKEFPVLGL